MYAIVSNGPAQPPSYWLVEPGDPVRPGEITRVQDEPIGLVVNEAEDGLRAETNADRVARRAGNIALRLNALFSDPDPETQLLGS